MRQLIAVFVFLSGMITIQAQSPDTGFFKEIRKYRILEARKFRNPRTSPIKDDSARTEFSGVEYFPADISIVVEAQMTRPDSAIPFEVGTSAGKIKRLVLYATLTFELEGQWLQLEAYKVLSSSPKKKNDDELFLPFKDLTSGAETYGGGRYIDLEIPKSGNRIVIDFNKAYNPYCAYSAGWNCILVPEANWVDVEIRAGARGWLEH